jgi:hypothetical protein
MDFQSKPRIIYFINDFIHSVTFSDILKKRWKVLLGILLIMAIIFIGYSIWNYQVSVGWGTNSQVDIIYIIESDAPQGNVIHLTEEDFKKFPKLAPIIRDKTQRIRVISNDGKRITYTIFLTDDERYQFVSLYFPPKSNNLSRFFEYNGKYYAYDTPVIS